MSTTIRVSDATRDRVASLAESSGKQMQVIVDEAVDAYERSMFWDRFEEAYDRLVADDDRWAEVERWASCVTSRAPS